MTGAARRDAVAAEVRLADDAMRAADALIAAKLPNDAVSRAYYAAFHYARALLFTLDLEPKTHRGVLSLIAKHFEAEGKLPREAVSAIARLQTFRALADYDARERIADERASEEVASAHGFVAAARALLVAGSWLD